MGMNERFDASKRQHIYRTWVCAGFGVGGIGWDPERKVISSTIAQRFFPRGAHSCLSFSCVLVSGGAGWKGIPL